MCNGVPTWGGCLPIISNTIAASQITGTTAVSGDTLLNEGGTETVTGVCYSTNPNPTIANSVTLVRIQLSLVHVLLS